MTSIAGLSCDLRLFHLFLFKAASKGNHGHPEGNYRDFSFLVPMVS